MYFLPRQEGPTVSFNAATTLHNFCVWQQTQNVQNDSHPSHHDTALLITRCTSFYDIFYRGAARKVHQSEKPFLILEWGAGWLDWDTLFLENCDVCMLLMFCCFAPIIFSVFLLSFSFREDICRAKDKCDTLGKNFLFSSPSGQQRAKPPLLS